MFALERNYYFTVSWYNYHSCKTTNVLIEDCVGMWNEIKIWYSAREFLCFARFFSQTYNGIHNCPTRWSLHLGPMVPHTLITVYRCIQNHRIVIGTIYKSWITVVHQNSINMDMQLISSACKHYYSWGQFLRSIKIMFYKQWHTLAIKDYQNNTQKS